MERGQMDLKSSGTRWRNLGPVLFRCFSLITALLTACSFVTRMASPGAVSIRPAQDTAWLTGARTSPSFEIPLIVHNASSVTVNTDWCVIKAERFIEGTWQTVFHQNFLLNSSPSVLRPGDSVTLDFLPSAIIDPSAAQKMTPGVYRAVVALWTVDRSGTPVNFPEPKRRSSTFIVARR
jgi:hypothetical protein